MPTSAGSNIGKTDLDRYRAEVSSLAEKLTSRPGEMVVWEVYARTEKLIAVLRFRLDHETPGVFAKLPKADDPDKLVAEARALLGKAAQELSEERAVESIATLRKARNNLRSYLRENKLRPERRVRPAPGPG